VDLTCSDGTFARAAVPSGASTGILTHSFLSIPILPLRFVDSEIAFVRINCHLRKYKRYF